MDTRNSNFPWEFRVKYKSSKDTDLFNDFPKEVKQVFLITCCKSYKFFISTQFESFGADGYVKIDPLKNNPVEDIFSHYPSFGFSRIH